MSKHDKQLFTARINSCLLELRFETQLPGLCEGNLEPTQKEVRLCDLVGISRLIL